MSNKSPSQVDVLIIGAGPAGLCCANTLAVSAVNVRIVDQKPSKLAAGQADGVMPRTTEMFQSYGLVDKLLAAGSQAHMIAVYNERPEGGIARTKRVPMINEKNARYPFAITTNQGAIESILIESMAERGVTVERPVRPTSITLSDEAANGDPNSYAVKVILTKLDVQTGQDTNEQEEVHAKFVLGADGAHSWVRGALGIDMEGDQTNHAWGAVEFTLTPEANFPDWRQIVSISALGKTVMNIPREDEKVRVYIELGEEHDVVDKATGRVDSKKFAPKRLIEMAQKVFAPYVIAPKEIGWWTVYIIGQRVASTYSIHERVFLAGDACHTHSPNAAQGMNVSMADAHNLAWKLPTVLRGRADLSLLKTYEEERRSFAQQLIAFDKWYAEGFSSKSRTQLFDGADAKPMAPFDAFREMSSLTSGIGVKYAPSVLTSSSGLPGLKELQLGQRIPPAVVLRAADMQPVNMQDLCPADARFKVLVFAGHISDDNRAARLKTLSTTLDEQVIAIYGTELIDIVTVLKGKNDAVDYIDVPAALRPHWTKVLLDDTDSTGKVGGALYETYGIGDSGALLIVRPDGYVALVVNLEDVQRIRKYFSGFLKSGN